jgi:asparagine synthase (glutamine-hydrolysing)
MHNASGAIWVIYNGEIYNYRELRQELQARGHVFRTRSDTEVILHAYEEDGVSCAARFNGIFAFALWDASTQRLVLARDHFGVKPLYYACAGGVFRFASELKAILVDPSVPREVDLEALNLCLTFRHTPSPWTLLKGIHKLPPASYAVVSRGEVRTARYWEMCQPTLVEADEAGLVEALAERLERAVSRQMVSDVPLSLSLSSGVDSCTLLGIMSRHSSEPVRAFTVGFDGQAERSEIGPAAETARHFGADFWSQRITEEDYAAFLARYIWHLEEPIGNESAPAYYFVARMAQAHGIKVMLNGQGPDEAFAGYGRHLGGAYAGHLASLVAPLARRALVPLADRAPLTEPQRRLAYALGQRTELDQLLSIYTFVSPTTRARLIEPSLRRLLDPEQPRAYLAAQLARAPSGTRLERMLWVDTRTSLPDNLLLCEDKMAMAAGVEARVPFLDVEFMELAERVPGHLKLRWGRGKRIHRRVCARFVPPAVARRPKIGFDTAVDRWLRARLGRELRQAIGASDSLTQALLSRATVHELLDEHERGRRDHQRLLFLLLSLEAWHRAFVRGERDGIAGSEPQP